MIRHLLIFRFTALGDVAMTVPVIRLLLEQYPELNVTVVSSAFVEPLFQNVERLRFYAADLKGRHKGVAGMYRLYKELKVQMHFDAVADLHNVLRTKILRGFFRFSNKPMAIVDKGRKEKKELTREKNKILRPLKSTFQRYADVLAQVGLPVMLETGLGLCPKPSAPEEALRLKMQGCVLVGLAPFAAYAEKTYPPEKMKEVVHLLTRNENVAVFLFGGKAEKDTLAEWEPVSPNIYNRAGLGLATELGLIAHLDIMVSMDSANMHLASLYGVPVVSVWGGTHPYLGFMGWGQRFENAVQIDLSCRPSSVFGNKPCPNNCACMEGINPRMIYEKVLAQLNSHGA